MSETNLAAFLQLVSGRRGHFLMESGYHGGLWLDLDPLFADAALIEPFVEDLSRKLAPHNVSVVCGALVGGAFLAQLLAPRLHAEFAFTERAMPKDPDGGLYQARYRLPPAFANRLQGKRVAIVDDIMSAGSALRGTYVALQSQGIETVVAGSLAVRGSLGADFFGARNIPVESSVRDDYEFWPPDNCPRCEKSVPLEVVSQ